MWWRLPPAPTLLHPHKGGAGGGGGDAGAGQVATRGAPGALHHPAGGGALQLRLRMQGPAASLL